MIRIVAAAFLCLTFASPAFAATKWKVAPDAKAITWQATQAGGSFEGACSAFDADVTFDPADLATSSVAVRIDMAKCLTGEATKDTYLPQVPWFDVASFPQATFEAKKFRHIKGDDYMADGSLTLKGVTKPVSLPFTLVIDGKTAHVTGETTLQRLAFGVGDGAQLSAPSVAGPNVLVKIDLKATKE